MFIKALWDFTWSIFSIAIAWAASVLFTFIAIAQVVNESEASAWFFAFLAALWITPAAFVAFYRERREREKISPAAGQKVVQQLESLIEEGTHLATHLQKPRQAVHNPLDPTHPEFGHPDARLAVDFYARAFEALPHGYANDLRIALRPALDENDRRAIEMVEREAEEARREGREPRAVFSWQWPVIVEVALKHLSVAHKALA